MTAFRNGQVMHRPLAFIVIAQFFDTSLWFSANSEADDRMRAWGAGAAALGQFTSTTFNQRKDGAETTDAQLEVTCFALMANGQDKHEVVRNVEFVKCNVACIATRDDKFPVTPCDRPAYQGMLLQHPEAADQQRCGIAGSDGIGFEQEIRESVDIPEGRGRQYEPGQDRFTGFGRLGLLPATLLSM